MPIFCLFEPLWALSTSTTNGCRMTRGPPFMARKPFDDDDNGDDDAVRTSKTTKTSSLERQCATSVMASCERQNRL
jgi:hypothetical protein